MKYTQAILFMVLFIAILISGCSSSNSGTSYSTYVNGTYNMSISYPSNWAMQEGDSGTIVIFYPDMNASSREYEYFIIHLDVLGSSESPSTIDDYYRFAIYESFSHARRNGSIIDKSNLTLDGRPAGKVIYEDKVNGVNIKGMMVYTVKDTVKKGDYRTTVYVLEYVSRAENYDKRLKDIQYMIDSFRVT